MSTVPCSSASFAEQQTPVTSWSSGIVTYRIKERFVTGEEDSRGRSELEVTPAASQRSRDSDRQLWLSFVARIQRSNILHKPQTDTEIAIFLNTPTLPMQNCAWIEFLLEGKWRSRQLLFFILSSRTSQPLGFPLIHCVKHKKREISPASASPPVPRRAVYLPVYRRSTLNILSNRGRFPSKAGLVWRQPRKA